MPKEEGPKEGGAEKAEDLMSTKKPKAVDLPDQDMTVMQVDCGLFHTGEESLLACSDLSPYYALNIAHFPSNSNSIFFITNNLLTRYYLLFQPFCFILEICMCLEMVTMGNWAKETIC